MDSHFADVNGVRLHYIESGTGTLVLFLHGFPEFHYAWRKQVATVGARHHAVAFDTRGINRSTGPDAVDGYDFDRLVGDVTGMIDFLGAERAVIVGHDWGGAIAWETAIRHPGRVEKLVVVNCGHPGVFGALIAEGGAQARASAYMLAFRSPEGEALVSRDDYRSFDDIILRPGLDAGHLTEADAAAYRAAWRVPGSVSHGLNYYRAAGLGAARDLDATVVRVPTMVIWGEGDAYMVPENLERLPSVVPDLRIERFPDNDHWIVHQRPDDVSRLILDFIG